MEALGNETYSFSVPGHETCIPQNTTAGSPEGTSAGGGMTAFSCSHSGGKLALEAETFCGVAGDSSLPKSESSKKGRCQLSAGVQLSSRLSKG